MIGSKGCLECITAEKLSINMVLSSGKGINIQRLIILFTLVFSSLTWLSDLVGRFYTTDFCHDIANIFMGFLIRACRI